MSKIVKVNLSRSDSEALKSMAKAMQTTQSEVIRKGLQLMELYSKSLVKNDNVERKFILEEDNGSLIERTIIL